MWRIGFRVTCTRASRSQNPIVRVDLLSVPYDSGVRGARMGAGPEKLMESGLIARVQQAGHEVVACSVCLPSQKFIPEVQAAFELDRRLAACVAEAVAA